jgi:hypothetical protein
MYPTTRGWAKKAMFLSHLEMMIITCFLYGVGFTEYIYREDLHIKISLEALFDLS